MTKPETDRRGTKMPLVLCLIAIVAPGLSCSGSADEADPDESHYECPTREESASFLAALRNMESSRTDTGEFPRVLFFEDTSIEAAWDTARWEVRALKSWPEFNEQDGSPSWFFAGTHWAATSQYTDFSPQEALLEAIDNWVNFLEGVAVTGSSKADRDTLRTSSSASLGPFEYERSTTTRETGYNAFAADITDSAEVHTTVEDRKTRRRISRSGQSYSSVTKMEITDSITGSSFQGGFFPKTDGLELTDIVRGLIEYSVPPHAYSFIFLTANEGEFYRYRAYVTGTLSKSK